MTSPAGSASSSNVNSPDTRTTVLSGGDGARRSTRVVLQRRDTATSPMTPAASGARGRLRFDDPSAEAASASPAVGERTVHELTTPRDTSTPNANGPRTVTGGTRLARSSSMFDFSRGSPLRTVATAVGTLGVGYLASSFLPPEVSRFVTGLASSAFYTQTTPRTPAELLRGGSQLNLTNVTVAGLLGITALASTSPVVRSTAASASSAAVTFLTPSRKRKESAGEGGAPTATVSSHVDKSGKSNARPDDSGLNEDSDGSYTEGSGQRNTSKRPKAANSSAASASEGAGAADGTSAEELLRAKHERLLKQGKDLTAKLKAARDTSTPATSARTTRASSSVSDSVRINGKGKAAVHDTDDDSDAEVSQMVSFVHMNAQEKKEALKSLEIQFTRTGNALALRVAHGKKTTQLQSPARVMQDQSESFQDLVAMRNYENAYRFIERNLPSGVSRCPWGRQLTDFDANPPNPQRGSESKKTSGDDIESYVVPFRSAAQALKNMLEAEASEEASSKSASAKGKGKK